jgi:hypothetical protein
MYKKRLTSFKVNFKKAILIFMTLSKIAMLEMRELPNFKTKLLNMRMKEQDLKLKPKLKD